MEKLESIHKIRQKIDKKYIGFVPQNTSVKPVHIANGLFKRFYGNAYDTKDISKLSYVQNAKGKIPRGQGTEEVKKYFEDKGKIATENIGIDNFQTFRLFLQDIINADKGVFTEKNSMIAFSLTSKMFLNTDTIYQDAGEFIASVIANTSTKIVEEAKKALDNEYDPISLLFSPAKIDNETKKTYESNYYEDLEFCTEDT
jgi:hypothetical protein